MYSHFNELIDYFDEMGVKIGLVTNGLSLHKANIDSLNKITWCRISNGDDRNFGDSYRNRLSSAVAGAPKVDWAFSHVVSKKPNYEEIARIMRFGNEHNFPHVRLVADLFQPEDIEMDSIKKKLNELHINDSRIVYQGRKAFTQGGECYIGYLKPLIGPDAKIYACCGVQYALEKPSRDLPMELCLGNAVDIDKIMRKSNMPLNGSICVKCYYMNYNILLRGLLSDVDHKEFV